MGRPTTMKSDPMRRASAGGSDAALVILGSIGITDTRGYRHESGTAGLLDECGLKRAADHTVESRLAGIAGVLRDTVVDFARDQKLAVEHLPGSACKLCDSDYERTRAVTATLPEAFDGGAHHLHATGGMDVDHVDIKTRKDPHRLADGVWNVVQFEIEENLMAALAYAAHYVRATGIEKLHAYFHERLFLLEAVEELENSLRRGKVACYDYFFIHLNSVLCDFSFLVRTKSVL